MEHELLHNEPAEYSVKQSTKTRKDREKIEPEKKKWNFRKSSSSSDPNGKQSPSPTSGLINMTNEARTKRTMSPTMIFENKINDNDTINNEQDLRTQSLPIKVPCQQHTPRSASFDQPRLSSNKKLAEKTMSLGNSPPLIRRPQQSHRKASDGIMRQTSAPAAAAMTSTMLPQRLTYQPTPLVDDNIQTEVVGEPLQDRTMWQGHKQQDLITGQWTDFSSNINEQFATSDTKNWSVAENVAIDQDEDEDNKETMNDVRNSSESSNASDSENEQEAEENVWKITEEQRSYYSDQFRVLQPAEKGVVTGQTARDFFLKSGLSTDVLSKIWNLADLDNDGALNFDEFCIAMHVVVAVRHGLDVPAVLPSYLVPEYYETQTVPSQKSRETSSKEQLNVPESQKWAKFSPELNNVASTPAASTTTTTEQVIIPEEENVENDQTATSPVQASHDPTSDTSPLEETPQQKESVVRKTSVGIPRMRVNVKKTNLLDTPHWAILPPPSKFTKETEDGSNTVPIGTIIPADENTNGLSTQPAATADINIEQHSSQDSDSSEDHHHIGRSPSLNNEQSDSSDSLSKTSSRESSGTTSHDSTDGRKISGPKPPPRKKTGHSRSSSLDLQKIFNKGNSNVNQPKQSGLSLNEKRHSSPKFEQNNVNDDGTDSGQIPKDNQENFADFSKFDNLPAVDGSNVVANGNNTTTTTTTSSITTRQRRSASLSSLDSTHAIWIEPSVPQPTKQSEPKAQQIPKVPVSLPRPVPKKKPADLPPPLRQKKDTSVQDGTSDGMLEKERKPNKEPIHFVVKPLTRLEQLHARIRDLKAKNTILSRVNNELQQELKQTMEKRIELESTVEQFKPLSNE